MSDYLLIKRVNEVCEGCLKNGSVQPLTANYFLPPTNTLTHKHHTHTKLWALRRK